MLELILFLAVLYGLLVLAARVSDDDSGMLSLALLTIATGLLLGWLAGAAVLAAVFGVRFLRGPR